MYFFYFDSFSNIAGDFTILKTLRRIHQGDKNVYNYLHLSHRDEAGNTILHLATKVCQIKFRYNRWLGGRNF